MRILFTGCTSQAGRRFFALLRDRGHYIVGISRQEVAGPSCRADLEQEDFASRLPDERFDVLIHFGSHVPLKERESRWDRCSNANLHGTARLLEWADGRVGRILLASSSAVYGEVVRSPIDETHPLRPETAYAVSKYGQEQLVQAFCKSRRLPLCVLRLGWVYGPDTPDERATVIFIRRILGGLPITLHGSRTTDMPLIHQEDIARIGEALLAGGHGTYNLAAGRHISLWEYVQTVMDVVGRRTEVVCDDRPNMPMGAYISCRELWERKGLRPEFSLRDGIASMLANLHLRQGSSSR